MKKAIKLCACMLAFALFTSFGVYAALQSRVFSASSKVNFTALGVFVKLEGQVTLATDQSAWDENFENPLTAQNYLEDQIPSLVEDPSGLGDGWDLGSHTFTETKDTLTILIRVYNKGTNDVEVRHALPAIAVDGIEFTADYRIHDIDSIASDYILLAADDSGANQPTVIDLAIGEICEFRFVVELVQNISDITAELLSLDFNFSAPGAIVD